jgi:DNA helicase IV
VNIIDRSVYEHIANLATGKNHLAKVKQRSIAEEFGLSEYKISVAVKNLLCDGYINIINKDSKVFTTGLVVIPSYLSKGLEFDATIIYDASDISYSKDGEKKLFYTICTRALHRLHIYYRGKLTPFISNMDGKLYDAVSITS